MGAWMKKVEQVAGISISLGLVMKVSEFVSRNQETKKAK